MTEGSLHVKHRPPTFDDTVLRIARSVKPVRPPPMLKPTPIPDARYGSCQA